MYDGIIFDIDGTLWDSRKVVADSWNAAIREQTDYDIQLEYESIGKLFGKPMNEIFSILFGDVSGHESEALVDLLYNYEAHYLDMYPPAAYDGVYETLERLSKKYKLYIVTNAQKGYTEKLFAATGICPLFTDWLCYGDTNAPKDVTLRRIIERNSIAHPVYIGDTQGDADACAKAGVPMIYAAYGLGEVENPSAVINDIRELPKMLEK